MIDLNKYEIAEHEVEIVTNDLVCFANIDKTMCDTIVLSDDGTSITIKGKFSPKEIDGKLAVAGGEIIRITSSSIVDETTVIVAQREQEGTLQEDTTGYHFRTVIAISFESEDIKLIDFSFNDTTGELNGSLFPVELGTGTVTLQSDLGLWSPYATNKKYNVRRKKSMAYIFKGVGYKRFLKHTCLISKLGYNTRGKTNSNRIKMELKSKLYQWYDKDITINTQLKGTTPKEFFKTLFSLNDNEVYYAQGVDPTGFLPLYNLHTKEYNKVSEMLKAYCSNGVRFAFDARERVKIFGDFKVGTLESMKTIRYNLTESMLTENDNMIYNTVKTNSVQRQTMFNFPDLDNKYVLFARRKENAIMSNQILSLQENGDITANNISIKDQALHSAVQLQEYVLFKTTVAPMLEVYGVVVGKSKDYQVDIVVSVMADKDYQLFHYGKSAYMYNILNNNIAPMDLYYARQALPIVWKMSRNKGGTEITSSLQLPILPRVDGVTKYSVDVSAEFGAPNDLKVGQYSKIVEEISKIYGVWNNSKLLYNREETQFSNTDYPPIFALSNKVNERIVQDIGIMNYTSFDNQNLELDITVPKDNNSDANIVISNTVSINSGIDLYVDKELSRPGRANNIIEVGDISAYKVGDVLIVNEPDDMTDQEELEFDEVLSGIRWTVLQKTSEIGNDGKVKHYLYLSSSFAKRQQANKVYEFTRFPNWSIVYLQELYFRGNPVVEFSQEVTGVAKTTTVDGDTSVDIYGDKTYNFDAKMVDKLGLRMIMGYVLSNCQATSLDTTKLVLPITVFNGIDLELFDVITVIDKKFTRVDERTKWVVVGLTTKNATNEIELKLLNINSKDTQPYKIDIKDVIEYTPVIVPDYDHAGGEGSGSVNDGGSGEDMDDSLGMIALGEVDPTKFRARVDRFDGNYIYFKDFSGTEYEEYLTNLFPESEFAVNIGGETIFVQSDQEYRAFVKRRNLYGTVEKTVPIQPEADVTFLILSTITGLDGTFYARKAHIGDAKSYLHVNPLTGVTIVGDFRVGENNKNSNNDLWSAFQKNKTYQQTTAPKSTPSYVLKDGDIWYDIDDENHCYRYNGNVWVSARDGSIVSNKNTVFIQPDEPKDKEGRPLVEGDTWYDSDDENKPYVYKGGKWVNVTDMGLQKAIEKTQQQADESTQKLEDIADDNKVTPDEKKQVSQEWEVIKVEYPKIVNEATKFGLTYSDYKLRYDTLNGYITPILSNMVSTTSINRTTFKSNFVNYYNSRQDILNSISTKTKELADNAQADATTALGNAKIFYQNNPPTSGMKERDLWYDTDDQNHPYVYINGKWTSARDKIFETEGGNKVYFQTTMPPSSGYGIKEGDQWFDTANNNTQYVLLKQSDGTLTWTLASDANDKIAKGRVVLNANTTVNGDFKVKNGNVELGGDTKIYGLLEVYGGSYGIVSYNGTSEVDSTQRIVIQGGKILFQEKI